MSDGRVLGVLRPFVALAALAAVLVLLGLAVTASARAATASPEPKAARTTGEKSSTRPAPRQTDIVSPQEDVRFGEDVVVPEGTSVPAAVAFGGDILVDGRVTGDVVAFGGSITINGFVGGSVVAFGGDVRLGPDARVGRGTSSSDAAVVVFGGELIRSPGSQVYGETVVNSMDWGKGLGWVARGLVTDPWWGFSFFGWVAQTAFFLVLALVAAALMPGPLRRLHEQLRRKPWPSLGWGALTLFVVVPAVLIVLVISIVGLLLVLPYALFVALACFFVTTGVASFLAQRIVTGFGGKENLMLAVTVGVVGTTIVSRVPGVGPMLVLAMMAFGTGSAVLGVVEWRRERRAAQALVAQAAAAAAAAATPVSADVADGQATIVPMVQTSPETSTAVPATGEAPPPVEVDGPEPPVGEDGQPGPKA